MISTSISQNSTYKASTSLARRLLMTAAVVALPSVANADFRVLDNKGDLNFNQLLGISNGQVIVGYFGDGNVVANNGYVLVPKNHYSKENFTAVTSTQTQAIGINNREIPEIVGFYADTAGVQHGFLDVEGVQLTVDDPKGVKGQNQNLLGINNNNLAAGFWTDKAGNAHGFVVEITPNTHALHFIEVGPNKFPGAVASQVAGINGLNQICGFWTDAAGNGHGFFGNLGGALTSFNAVINGTREKSTQVLGCNRDGEIVGSFVDSHNNTHGFVSDGVIFVAFDAPGSKQIPVFMPPVQGTIINGINNEGDIVGFFSDGKKVHGFVNFASPNGPE